MMMNCVKSIIFDLTGNYELLDKISTETNLSLYHKPVLQHCFSKVV